MKKWNLIVDIPACTNCNNCVVATQDEYAGNRFEGYSAPGAPGLKTLDVERHIRGEGTMVDVRYVPKMCNHCDDAPCIKAAPDVIYKRADGIVMIDPVKANGRSDLVASCPYGAIKWNAQENVPQNWYFDAHLLDQGWAQPRGVQSCPTGALQAMKCTDDEIADMARREGLTVLNGELNTRPRVYYKHFDQVATHFIGGNVSAEVGGVIENVPEVAVELCRGDTVVQSCRTDAFGDFRFERIAPGSEGHIVRARHARFGDASVALGEAVQASRCVQLTLVRPGA